MRGIFELDLLKDVSGDAFVVSGATVTVRSESTGSIATIYDAITGGSALPNPFTLAGSSIVFYADHLERYRVEIVAGTLSRTLRWRNVSIDAADIYSTSATYADGLMTAHLAALDPHGQYALYERITAAPNATVPVYSLPPRGAETNIDCCFPPKGSGAFLADVPDNTATGGNKRGTYAVDLQRVRSAATQVAAGSGAVVCGGSNNTASGTSTAIVGGESNIASGILSCALGGNINNASGVHSVIVGGWNNTASGDDSAIISGYGSTSSGVYSVVLGGNQNSATADFTTVLSSLNAVARNTSSVVHAGGSFATAGDAQHAFQPIRCSTTDATPKVLTTNNAVSPTTSNVTALPDNHAYAVTVRVLGRDTSTGDVLHMRVEGTVKRGTGAASTALDGTPVYTTVSRSAGAATWATSLIADTTNGAVEISVTGEAAKTIHWMAKIETVEVS